MVRRKSLRRRPSTPNLKLPQQHTAADPASPPETPTTSPPLSRKISLKPRHQPPFFDFTPSLTQDPSIKPIGGDSHQFSYQPTLTADQLSPRSSSSSSAPADDSADDNFTESASIGSLPNSSGPDPSDDASVDDVDDSGSEQSDDKGSVYIEVSATTVVCDFTIEDLDPMDSDNEGLDVLYPTEIESNRSRSRSRHTDHLDKGMMQDLKNLNCSNEASDNDAEPEADLEEDAFHRRQAELKRIRRVSMSSSFGKRTHSELSDSEDEGGFLDVNDAGFSARHMRKRLHRGSLLFQDPPAPRIDELEEPDSSEDEFAAEQSLARELPYWTSLDIMEVDSS